VGVNKMRNAENKMRNGICGIMLRNDIMRNAESQPSRYSSAATRDAQLQLVTLNSFIS